MSNNGFLEGVGDVDGVEPEVAVDDTDEGVGEEESNDRLWLVARSLKNEIGKYDYKI
jgi:hypothetical protein